MSTRKKLNEIICKSKVIVSEQVMRWVTEPLEGKAGPSRYGVGSRKGVLDSPGLSG